MKFLILILLQTSIMTCIGQVKYSFPDSLERIWLNEYLEKTKNCWQSFSVEEAIKFGADSACSLILLNNFSTDVYFVPNELGNLTRLKEIEIASHIKLVVFPEEIGRLKNLESLWIFSNVNEQSFPLQFSECDAIISLGLTGDSIFFKNLPKTISGLKGLRFLTLNMENHNSKKIYKSLYEIYNQNLKVLHLRDFNISSFKKRRIQKFYLSKGCNVIFY